MDVHGHIKNFKRFRRQNLLYFEAVISKELTSTYDVYLMNKNSYRIICRQSKKKVDFYPVKGRLFDHGDKKWLTVPDKEDVLMVIDSLLK